MFLGKIYKSKFSIGTIETSYYIPQISFCLAVLKNIQLVWNKPPKKVYMEKSKQKSQQKEKWKT